MPATLALKSTRRCCIQYPKYDDSVCSKLFVQSQEQDNFRSCCPQGRVIFSITTARNLTTTPEGLRKKHRVFFSPGVRATFGVVTVDPRGRRPIWVFARAQTDTHSIICIYIYIHIACFISAYTGHVSLSLSLSIYIYISIHMYMYTYNQDISPQTGRSAHSGRHRLLWPLDYNFNSLYFQLIVPNLKLQSNVLFILKL